MLKFTEDFEVSSGRTIQIDIKDKLHTERSDYQLIEVYETVPFGRMLTLDGIIQLTEFDNFAYHEMITHVAMQSHPNAKKILVIGGGDGGVAKELHKYHNVDVTVCELDERVCEVSKQFFANISNQLDNCTLAHQDGAKFVKDNSAYDVIIVDSSDPIGPATVLFESEFFTNCHDALNPDGILITQCESIFYHAELIKSLQTKMKSIFPIVDYYYTMVPTYPSGTIGFSFCSKRYTSKEHFESERANGLQTRYYNAGIHHAAFCLPSFMVDDK